MTHIKIASIIIAAMLKLPSFLQRLALVLLLVVAVPLQGYAAASIAICRALAHHGDQAAATAERHAHHGDEHKNAHASADHEKHGSPGDPAAKDSHQCAACASCGVAAAISAFPAIYASDTPDWCVVIASFPAPKGHVPEGLDRPPLAPLV